MLDLSYIDKIQHSAPFKSSYSSISRYIEKARKQKLQLNQTDESVIALQKLIAQPMEIVIPERKRAFRQCELYVLPFPTSVAWSQKLGNRQIIVIGRGMIQLIEHCTYSAYVIGKLPPEAQQIYPINSLPDLSLSDILNYFIFLLLYRFYRFAEPLPDLYEMISPDMHEPARISISGSVAFVLLHEFAHLALGHHDQDEVIPFDVHKIVPEDISGDKQKEIEADQFALNCIIEEYREFGHFWMKQAFDFFVRMEIISGQFTKSHPLALNRIFEMNAKVSGQWGYHDAAQSASHAQKLAGTFEQRHQEKQSPDEGFLAVSRETCLNILKQAEQACGDIGLDISPLFTAQSVA